MNHHQQCFVQPCLFVMEHEYSSISPGSLRWSRTNPLSCLPHHCVTVNTNILREEYDRGLSAFFWWALSRNWMVSETIKETIKKSLCGRPRQKMLYVDRLGLMLKCLRSLPFRSTKMKTFPLMIMRMVVRQRETVQRGMRLGGVEDASCFPNTLLVTHIHPERSLLTSSQSSHPCFNVTRLQPTVFY